MKVKPTRHIIFITVLILLFFGISVCERNVNTFHNYIISTGNVESFYPYNILILQFIVYFFAGTVFGLEKLISEKKKNGYWRINLPKLVFFGVPTFLISISVILLFMFTFIPNVLSLSSINFSLFTNFMQMFFGYTIITSFYKTE